MFKIVAAPRAWWPVTWNGVTEEGEIIENRIKMRFLLHKVDAAIDIMTKVRAQEGKARAAFEGGEELKASRLYAEAVKMFACDFTDVAIDDGTPAGKQIDWNDDNLAMLMNEPHVFDATFEAYRACQAGKRNISEGN